jgi:hypothetical protein
MCGPNRNGDGFTHQALTDHTGTFKKYARWYREHRNTRPERSYGVVKAAYYNPLVQRAELVVALNGTKQAAEKNGGLVADEEMEKLDSDRDLSVSMSCKVGYDLCSSCLNKAKTRKQYCTADMCKHGGLKENIGRVCEDGHHLHADNPEPQFFDISHVRRGADRTAFVLGKVASAQPVSGAELADILGITYPDHLLALDFPASSLPRLKIASALAGLSKTAACSDYTPAFDSRVYALSPLPDSIPPEDRSRAQALYALAARGVVLPFRDWLHVSSGIPREKCASLAEQASAALTFAFPEMQTDPDLPDLLKQALPESIHVPASLSAWAGQEAARLALTRSATQRRLWQAGLHGLPDTLTKTASHNSDIPPALHSLARAYAVYVAAALEKSSQHPDFPLMQRLAIVQNHPTQ